MGGNSIKPPEEFLGTLTYLFVHQTIPHFVYKAIPSQTEDGVELAWTPLTKGFYSLVINGEPVKTKTKLVVLAGSISP